MIFRILLSFFLILQVVACTDVIPYEKNYTLDDFNWPSSQKLVFPIDVKGTPPTKLFLNLRHTNDYPYSNIFILLKKTSPKGVLDSMLLEFSLAYPSGLWKGIGSGTVFSYSLPIEDESLSLEQGLQTITLQHYMRLDTLRHIMNVGLRLER